MQRAWRAVWEYIGKMPFHGLQELLLEASLDGRLSDTTVHTLPLCKDLAEVVIGVLRVCAACISRSLTVCCLFPDVWHCGSDPLFVLDLGQVSDVSSPPWIPLPSLPGAGEHHC